jgi:hypothetical protein
MEGCPPDADCPARSLTESNAFERSAGLEDNERRSAEADPTRVTV